MTGATGPAPLVRCLALHFGNDTSPRPLFRKATQSKPLTVCYGMFITCNYMVDSAL